MSNLKFPEESVTRVVPDQTYSGNGPWNLGLEREEIPVAADFFPIRAVRLESVESIQRHVRFVPPNDRVQQMPIGTSISRVSIWIAQLAIPQNIPIPAGGLPIHFRVYMGSNSASSLVASFTFSAKPFVRTSEYSELLVQISGLLCNQIEIYAHIDPADVPSGVKLGAVVKFHMHLDRLGGTAPLTSVAVLNGPETV